MLIRERRPADEPAVEPFLLRWHSLRVARRGRIERPLEHPALIAEQDGRLVGVLTYVVDGSDCEILTLHADVRQRGVGTALIEEVKRAPAAHACG